MLTLCLRGHTPRDILDELEEARRWAILEVGGEAVTVGFGRWEQIWRSRNIRLTSEL